MSKEEKETAIANDPLPALRQRLIAEKIADEAALTKMQEQIEAEIKDAIEFALASAAPSADELRRDVFATEIPA